MRLIPGDPAGRRPFPCLSCIARGLPCLLGHPRSGELLPPLFTLARHEENPIRAVCFLWHFPSGNPWEIPVSRFHGTRCLVMSGLSSTPVRRPEQRPPEPDRHGLHTLSSARGKAQSRHGKNFVSFFLSDGDNIQWMMNDFKDYYNVAEAEEVRMTYKAKRPQDCSRGRSNLLPMKTSLIH